MGFLGIAMGPLGIAMRPLGIAMGAMGPLGSAMGPLIFILHGTPRQRHGVIIGGWGFSPGCLGCCGSKKHPSPAIVLALQ